MSRPPSRSNRSREKLPVGRIFLTATGTDVARRRRIGSPARHLHRRRTRTTTAAACKRGAPPHADLRHRRLAGPHGRRRRRGHPRRTPDARRHAPRPGDDPAQRPAVRRTVTMVKETLLHTRMLQWHWVGIMHWFVYAGFIVLSASVLTGYFQLFEPRVRAADHRPLLPLRVGHRGARRAQHGRHRLPDRLPPAQPPPPHGPRRAASTARTSGRPTSSRRWRSSRAPRSSSSAAPSTSSTRRPAASTSRSARASRTSSPTATTPSRTSSTSSRCSRSCSRWSGCW